GETAARASIYRAFRAPAVRDLYRTSFSGRLLLLPNPDLEPEILTGGEFGVDHIRGRFSGEANLYYSEIHDLMTRILVSPGPVIRQKLVNLGASRSRGIELQGHWLIGRSWSLAAGYTWADSIVIDNPSDPSLEGKRVPEVSEHTATAGVKYLHSSGATGVLRIRSLSTQYADAANQLPLDAHTVVDVHFSWPVREPFELFISGENLFDQEYIVDQAAARRIGQPRQIHAGFRLHYDFPASSPGGQP
ncbi:MAG TPA: TonB-dependent receptor, partial [Thermoanaerobaculia bacterium]|nr:TonB-dependent receptor [Thermoanaerobaculia bacterium]